MAKTITITQAGNGWIVRVDYGWSVRTTVTSSLHAMIGSVEEFALENYETPSPPANAELRPEG